MAKKKIIKNLGKVREMVKAARENPKTAPYANAFIGSVAPAAAAFGANQLLVKILGEILEKKVAMLGKHAKPLVALGAFGGSWGLARNVKALSDKEIEILIGAALALLNTLIRTYMPGLGFLVGATAPTALPPSSPSQPQAQVKSEDEDDFSDLIDESFADVG